MDETRFVDLRGADTRQADRDSASERTPEADETGRGATNQGTTTAGEETPSTAATGLGLAGIPILGPLLAVLGVLFGQVWRASTALGAVVYHSVRFPVVVARRHPLVSVGLLIVAIIFVLFMMQGG